MNNNRNLIPFKDVEVPRLLRNFFTDFDTSVNDFFERVTGNVGRTNVIETEKQYHVELLMPGAEKDKINLDIVDNVLKISYSNQNENKSENGTFVRQEWSYSEFNRTFNLPENADASQIEASYNNGVLKLSINKKHETPKLSSKIEIK